MADVPKYQDAHCAGFDAFRQYPLYDAIFHRRTRRVSKGIKKWEADSLRTATTISESELAVNGRAAF
jgi:hypothetical protein